MRDGRPRSRVLEACQAPCHRRKKSPSPGTKGLFLPWITSLLCNFLVTFAPSPFRRFENLLLFSHSSKPRSLVYPAPSNHPDHRCLVPLASLRSMASDQEAANALKLQGNKAFAEHEWPTAVDFYTQAIEKYDKEPSFFSNRAQVCRPPTTALTYWAECLGALESGYANVSSWQAQIKLEAFGFAIADANKALELDPNYVKVSRCREEHRVRRRTHSACRRKRFSKIHTDALSALGILETCFGQHCYP